MCVCIYVRVYICACVYMCVCVYVYVCVCVYICVCVYMCIYIYIYIYIYMYICIYVCVYTVHVFVIFKNRARVLLLDLRYKTISECFRSDKARTTFFFPKYFIKRTS